MRRVRLTHFDFLPVTSGYVVQAGRKEDSNSRYPVTLTPDPLEDIGHLLRVQIQNLTPADDRMHLAPSLQYRLRLPGAGDFSGWTWVSSDGATPTSPNYPVRFLGNSGHNVAISLQSLSTPTWSTTPGWVNGLQVKQAGYANTITLDKNEYTELAFWLGPLSFPGYTDAWEFRVIDAGKSVSEHAFRPAIFERVGYFGEDEVGPLDITFAQEQGHRTPLLKLEAWQTNSWRDYSDRLYVTPEHPLQITRRLKGPATADLYLDNHDGLLARGNADSQHNSGGAFLDADRRIRIRQGWRTRYNQVKVWGLAAIYSPNPHANYPDAGKTQLTDSILAQDRADTDLDWVGWLDTNVTVVLSFGNLTGVPWRGAAVRALSRTSQNVSFPTSAHVVVTDGADKEWTYPLECAHLTNDARGQSAVLVTRDAGPLDTVKTLTFKFAKVQSQYVLLDEIAVYCASTIDWYRTTFSGLLGDSIGQDADDRALVRLGQVRDATKRLADNYIQQFAHYKHSANTPNTVEQIISDILSSVSYGVTAPFSGYSTEPTGFVFPKWTEQNASVYDACSQLAKSVGWVFGADDDGTWRLWEPPADLLSPQRYLVAGHNLLDWTHEVSDRSMRNHVIVTAMGPDNNNIRAEAKNQASINSYGERRFFVNEPSLKTSVLCRRLARAILRDYGWVQRYGQALAWGDLTLRPGMVVGIVDSFASYSKATELYRVDGQVTRQTGHLMGDITEELALRAYNPLLPSAPESFTAQSQSGAAILNWLAMTEDPSVVGYGVYQAGSLGDTFALVDTPVAPPDTTWDLTNDVPYWFEVAGFTAEGIAGDRAGPLMCMPTSGAPVFTQAEMQWVPTSVTATAVDLWGVNRATVKWYGGQDALTAYKRGRSFESHVVQRAVSTPGPWEDAGSVLYDDTATTLQQYRDSLYNLPAGTYYYRVQYYRATDGFYSAPSSIVGVTV